MHNNVVVDFLIFTYTAFTTIAIYLCDYCHVVDKDNEIYSDKLYRHKLHPSMIIIFGNRHQPEPQVAITLKSTKLY